MGKGGYLPRKRAPKSEKEALAVQTTFGRHPTLRIVTGVGIGLDTGEQSDVAGHVGAECIHMSASILHHYYILPHLLQMAAHVYAQ